VKGETKKREGSKLPKREKHCTRGSRTKKETQAPIRKSLAGGDGGQNPAKDPIPEQNYLCLKEKNVGVGAAGRKGGGGLRQSTTLNTVPRIRC